MRIEKLCKILEESTEVYRKGESVEVRKVGGTDVTELYWYKHVSESPKGNNFYMVDMIFVDVNVNRKKAEEYKRDLENILQKYPQPERLAGGPSYIELAGILEIEQEYALRLMALGYSLGLWNIISGKTLGVEDDITTREMAGQGFLMISGYNPKLEDVENE